jgi:hypothetical protein
MHAGGHEFGRCHYKASPTVPRAGRRPGRQDVSQLGLARGDYEEACRRVEDSRRQKRIELSSTDYPNADAITEGYDVPNGELLAERDRFAAQTAAESRQTATRDGESGSRLIEFDEVNASLVRWEDGIPEAPDEPCPEQNSELAERGFLQPLRPCEGSGLNPILDLDRSI